MNDADAHVIILSLVSLFSLNKLNDPIRYSLE